MMFLKLTLLLMGLGLVLGYRLKTSLKTDEKINQLHKKSMVLAQDHKDLSSSCFATYNPQLNAVVSQYEKDYDGCMAAYESSSDLIQNGYKDTRERMEKSVSRSCQCLKDCLTSSNAYNLFECVSARTSQDAKIFYEISANATDAAAKSRSDYRRVETTKDICVNAAERDYVEKTSNVYGMLNSCLVGNFPGGPPPPPQEAPPSPPEEAPEEAPETSTAPVYTPTPRTD